MKRAAVFAYYDRDGIVDDYVPVLLNGIRPYVEKLLCVVNGDLGEKGRERLESCSDEIIYRENSGYDVTAYKVGAYVLKTEDWDEVLFFNATVYGPICSFQNVFDKMDGKDLDFWGLTRHCKTLSNHVEGSGLDYIPEHIQSYFFAVRKEMLNSKSFDDYWNDLPEIRFYEEAVIKHELRFTSFFEESGFHWDTYIEPTLDDYFYQYQLMVNPIKLIEEQKCPVVKRKYFLHTVEDEPLVPMMGKETQLLEYIREKTDYDVDLIVRNIIRTEITQDYEDALFPTFLIDENDSDMSGEEDAGSTAVFVILDNEEYIPYYQAMKRQSSKTVFTFFCSTEEVFNKVSEEMPEAFSLRMQDWNVAVIMRQLLKAEEEYILFSWNCFMGENRRKRETTEYIYGIEELYKNTELFSDCAKLKRILKENNDIRVLIPVVSQYNATLSRKNRAKYDTEKNMDLSSIRSASMTFFTKADTIKKVGIPKELLTVFEEDTDAVSALASYLAKRSYGLVGYISSKDIEHSYSRMLLPSERRTNNAKHLVEKYDEARAFMYNFLTEKSLKERIWFLLLALSPSYRKRLYNHHKENLINRAEWSGEEL